MLSNTLKGFTACIGLVAECVLGAVSPAFHDDAAVRLLAYPCQVALNVRVLLKGGDGVLLAGKGAVGEEFMQRGMARAA